MDYSVGNLKIGKDTLILNMGSAKDCPSKKLGLCKIANCYAFKAEYLYPNVLPFRMRQADYWLSNDAVTIAEDISYVWKFNNSRNIPLKFVRINEVGDLYSHKCLTKLIHIAKMLPNIVFYTYTHRSDIVDNGTYKRLPSNLVLNCSNFNRKGLNTFKAIVSVKVHSMKAIFKVRNEILKFSDFACFGDCSKCGYCKKQHGKVIGVPLH